MRISIYTGCFRALAGCAVVLMPFAVPAAAAQSSASPSGQVYQTRFGAETSSRLAIEFGSGEGEGGGTVSITQLDTMPYPPPAGLEFGMLGQWSQAADGSVTVSGSLYFLPDGGPAMCESWAADYSGEEETCWFSHNGVSYGPLLLQ
ncbi:hypothetical protein [Maricaulis sp.]|uniref:hypothetical protein n=1 Tax=Maricaulis sp. TaxID=1486257 RepID=UPI003A94B8E0